MKLAIFLVFTALAPAASLLEQHIDEVLRTSKALAPASYGIEVIQLRSGKVLYSRNADKLLIPASNTKLFSAALALVRLGKDYRFSTGVFVTAGPDADGVVEGDLILKGGGDPTMSDLMVPFDRDAKPGDPLAAMDQLADQIVARGVREIRGSVIGDSTAWPWEPIPPGWGADDPVWEYGAPVAALTFNNGRFRLIVAPGENESDPANIALDPPLEYFAVANRVSTSGGKMHQVRTARPLGSRELRLTGTIARSGKPLVEEVAVDDPALFAAMALQDALARRGIRVTGDAGSRYREPGDPPVSAPPGRQIAERRSPPLAEVLQVTAKVSQNLWAEMVLRETARQRRGDGSRKEALDELRVFLKEAEIGEDGYSFEDGSGLSRMGLVAPNAVNRLLRYMAVSPFAGLWKSLLPIAGVDGTLEKRFGKNPAAAAISAKTGSLSHVNALSGYAESATYGELVFSIIVNHTTAPSFEVRSAIDKIALALLD